MKTVLFCFLIAILSSTTPAIAQNKTPVAAYKYDIGDFLYIGAPITKYLDSSSYETDESIPTYDGLQVAIENYYRDIFKDFNAIENEDSCPINVTVRHEDINGVDITVSLIMRKVNRETAGTFNFNDLLGNFSKTDLPLKFEIEVQLDSRLSMRFAGDDEKPELPDKNVSYTVDQFTWKMRSHASALVSDDGRYTTLVESLLIPKGFVPLEFKLCGLTFAAHPEYFDFNAVLDYDCGSKNGGKEITGDEFSSNGFKITRNDSSCCFCQCVLTHPEARGALRLRADNADLVKNKHNALCSINGVLRFERLGIGDRCVLQKAALQFSGSLDTVQISGALGFSEAKRMMPSIKGAPDPHPLVVYLKGMYHAKKLQWVGKYGETTFVINGALNSRPGNPEKKK